MCNIYILLLVPTLAYFRVVVIKFLSFFFYYLFLYLRFDSLSFFILIDLFGNGLMQRNYGKYTIGSLSILQCR